MGRLDETRRVFRLLDMAWRIAAAPRHWTRKLLATHYEVSERQITSDLTVCDGVRLIAAARTILDAAEAGTAPEQIEKAVTQAIKRGLTTTQQLLQYASQRSRRASRLIADALGAVQR